MTGGHSGGTTKAEQRRRRIVRGVALLVAASIGILIAIFVSLRYFTPEESGPMRACRARLYDPYDPKNLEQCMAVCMICSAGVKTTCSTSCMLRGAR